MPETDPSFALVRKLLPRLSDEDESRLTGRIRTSYNSAKMDRSEWETRLAEWEGAYHNKVGKKDFPWPGCSNFHVPITFMGVETSKPRLAEGIIGQTPPIQLTPSTQALDEKKDTVEAFLNWQVQTTLDLPQLVSESAHLFLQPGMSIAKTFWKVERKRRKFVRTFPFDTSLDDVLDAVFGIEKPINIGELGKLKFKGYIPTTPQGGSALECQWEFAYLDDEVSQSLQILVERDEVIEGPDISLIDPIDIFVPVKGGQDPNKLPWIQHRMWMDEDDLRKKAKQGRFYADIVEDIIESGPPRGDQPTTDSHAYRASVDATEGVQGQGPSNVRRDQWEVLEDYRRYDIDGDGFEEEIITWMSPHAEGRILGWDYLDNVYAHGRRPFRVGRYFPIPFRWYGLAFAEVVKGVQDEINAIHNQRVDYATIQNMPFGIKRSSSSIPNTSFRLRPGEFLEVDNPQTDVVFPRWQGEPAWGQQEEALLMQYFERITGLNDLSLGRQPNRVGATRTAAGTQTLLSEAGLRFKGAMTGFQEFWLGIFEDILALDQEYLPPGTEFRVTGKRPSVVRIKDRTEIRGKYTLKLVSTAESMNRQRMREDASVILQATLNPALMQGGVVGLKGVRRALGDFYRAYGKDPEFYMEAQAPVLTPEEELQRFLGGEYVSPVMSENIQAHMQAHEATLQDPLVTPEVKKLVMQHLQETVQLAQTIQMQQMLAQTKPQVAGPQAVNAQQGRGAVPPQPGVASQNPSAQAGMGTGPAGPQGMTEGPPR